MSRCDYCTQRFTWDCEDCRVSDNDSCDSFCLDWNTLSNDAKDRLQEWIMTYKNYLTKD